MKTETQNIEERITQILAILDIDQSSWDFTDWDDAKGKLNKTKEV